MKKLEIREIIREIISKLAEEFNGYDASGHVEDLDWYPKSLEEFEKEYGIKETSANVDGDMINYNDNSQTGRSKLKTELFNNNVDKLIKIIEKYIDRKFPDETRNKKLMKLMHSDMTKMTRMLNDWKRAR